MSPSDSSNRLTLFAIGLLVLLAPVVILALTLYFLSLTGNLVLGRVTPLEFLELYVLELLVVAGFAYGLYRLTLGIIADRLPGVLDEGERESPLDDEPSDRRD